MQMNDMTFVLRSLKGHCYDKRFFDELAKIGQPHFHSSHCHPTADWKIATMMGALTLAMTKLAMDKKMVSFGPVNPEFVRLVCVVNG